MDTINTYFTRQAFKNGFTILKAAFSGFMNDLALKYSASLAYYTLFSLAPMFCYSYLYPEFSWERMRARARYSPRLMVLSELSQPNLHRI